MILTKEKRCTDNLDIITLKTFFSMKVLSNEEVSELKLGKIFIYFISDMNIYPEYKRILPIQQ
jgi:hypothetical protein